MTRREYQTDLMPFYSDLYVDGSTTAVAAPLHANGFPEHQGVNLSDPAVYDLLVDQGGTSAAGVRVNPRTALGIPAFWQAVWMIAGNVCDLPLYLYERQDDGSALRLENHRVDQICSKISHPELHAFEFWFKMMVNALMHHESFAMIDRSATGEVNRMTPLLPGCTWLERIEGELFVITVVVNDNPETVPELGESYHQAIPYDDVFHLRGITYGGDRACDLIRYHRDILGLTAATIRYSSRFFRRGGRMGGILQMEEGLDKTRKDNIENTFRKVYEDLDASFRVIALSNMAKFQSGQMTPEQTQMISSRQENVRDIARIFNLPPSRLGEESRSGYNSKAEDNRDYIERTLSYWLNAIAAQANKKLVARREYLRGRLWCEHDTSDLTELDKHKRFQIYEIAKRNKIFTTNEIRAKESAPLSTDPAADILENPNTSSPTAPTQNAPPPAEPTPAAAQAHRDLMQDALARTLRVAKQRIVRGVKNDLHNFSAAGELPAIVRRMVDACGGILAAVESIGGPKQKHAAIFLHGTVASELEQVVAEALASLEPEQDLRQCVEMRLDAYLQDAASRLADEVIGI